MTHQPGSADSGFTLLEVTVAAAILGIVTSGLASASLAAAWSAVRGRREALATFLAVERMEQLRGLEWGHGDSAAPSRRSDLTTDLAASPAGPAGRGLASSPSHSLTSNVEGWVDYLDASGRSVGRGAVPPPAAAFARRWRVSILPASADVVVLEVVVSAAGGIAGALDRPDDVRLVTTKARKAW